MNFKNIYANKLQGSLPHNILVLLFTMLCGYVCFRLLRYHLDLIFFPWPIQFRETANLLSTDLLLKGGNPYLLENQPVYTNVYGLLYNFVTYPVAAVLGPTLTVHKAVGGFFTLCSCLLVYGMLKRDGVSRVLAWGGALIVYSSLLFGKTSLAEPDSLGLFLYLLTVTLPITFKFSNRSLLASSLVGILGFYAKPYFIIALPFVCLYVFFFVSRKKGVQFIFLTIVLFILTSVIVNTFFETYFYNTYLIHRIVAGANIDWMIKQWLLFEKELEELLAATFIAAMAAILSYIARKRCKADSSPVVNDIVASFGKISLPFFLMLAIALVFSVKLGLHNGAYMTYLFQLVAPLLVLTVFPLLGKQGGWQFLILPLVALSLLRVSGGYRDINLDFRKLDRGNWQRAKDYVATHRNILNSAAIAPLLFEQGKPIYDSGQSEYFQHLLKTTHPDSFFPLKIENITRQSLKYKQQIVADIVGKRFDLLMLDRSFSSWIAPTALISQYYNRRDLITLYMPHTRFMWQVDVWEPKP